MIAKRVLTALLGSGRVLQLALTHLSLPVSRPFVPLDALVIVLDAGIDELTHSCEDGTFEWSFDFASPGAGRRKLHVLRDSVAALAGRIATKKSFSDITNEYLPHRDLRSTQIEHLFSLSQQHVRDLFHARLFTESREQHAGSGPNGYRVFTRASVLEFLRARRVT